MGLLINIGLTTFSDHPSLIGEDRKVKLSEYSAFFPVVELDTPFYAIPRREVIENWQHQVPDNFQFILKANRLMTLHDQYDKDEITDESRQQAFQDYLKAVFPLRKANQLKTILFQFPPSFKRSLESIDYLRNIRVILPGVSISVEFRNSTWYTPEIKDDVSGYLSELHMTQVIVDEPHATNMGVPFSPVVTDKNLAMLRLHGRNVKGWTSNQNWRKQRTLYRYSSQELQSFADTVKTLNKEANEVVIIFNNNSGGDAADNALELKKMLGINFNGLAPMQLDLF